MTAPWRDRWGGLLARRRVVRVEVPLTALAELDPVVDLLRHRAPGLHRHSSLPPAATRPLGDVLRTGALWPAFPGEQVGEVAWRVGGTLPTPPALEGHGLPSPFGATWRMLVVVRGEARLRFPLADVAEASELRLGPGQGVAWDLDREVIGVEVGPFLAVQVDRAVGPVWPFRPPARPSPWRAALASRLGIGNLTRLAALLGLGAALGGLDGALLFGSYLHYAIYLATFGWRQDVSFPAFLRDATFFKATSMTLLGLALVLSVGAGFSLLGLLLMGVGLGLSNAAVARLGVVRTMFGVELGVVPPERVEGPPYGWVPHPMIVGAVLALIGAGLQPGMAERWPWLVPGHVALYLLHLAQEVRQSRPLATA